MSKTFLITKIVPVIAVLLCCLLYLSGQFQMIIAAIILIIASAIEYRKDLFKSLGFQRKRLNAKDLLIIAPLFGTGFFLLYYYVLVPGMTSITGQPMDFSLFEPYIGNLPAIAGLFVLMWASAAFAEEIIFKGYLMNQFTKFFGSSRISLVINILLFGFIFGWLHAYQGISGQILSGLVGMVFAIIFHFRKKDLWFNVAAHGFFDTAALVFIYFGWS